jgi:hypothetical protein
MEAILVVMAQDPFQMVLVFLKKHLMINFLNLGGMKKIGIYVRLSAE